MEIQVEKPRLSRKWPSAQALLGFTLICAKILKSVVSKEKFALSFDGKTKISNMSDHRAFRTKDIDGLADDASAVLRFPLITNVNVSLIPTPSPYIADQVWRPSCT
jgi:hypothetical protein